MSFAALAVGEFMCPLGSSCSGLLPVPMLLPSPPPDAIAVAATAIAATAATYNYCCYLQLLLLLLLLLMPTSFKVWSVLQHGLKTGSHSKTFSSRLEIKVIQPEEQLVFNGKVAISLQVCLLSLFPNLPLCIALEMQRHCSCEGMQE